MFLRRFTDIAVKKPRFSILFIAAIVAVLGTSLVVHAASAGATIKLGPSGTLPNPPNSVVVTVQDSCMPSQFNFCEARPSVRASPVSRVVLQSGFTSFDRTRGDYRVA